MPQMMERRMFTPQRGVDGAAVRHIHIQTQAAEAVFFDQPVVVRHDDQRILRPVP